MIERNRVYNLPAVELLSRMDRGSVGAVIMDPPFFIGIGRSDGGVGHDPWSTISNTDGMVEWSMELATQVARVLRPGGACVVMGGAHSISAWQVAADRVGLSWMAEMTVLWNTGKPRSRNFGSLTTTIRWHTKPGARHVFNSGERRAIYSNVLVCDKVALSDRVHPAQKPAELTNFLVSLLTNDDDLVVDPFCGSGSTLVSAAMCGRDWIGGDTDHEHCHRAEIRTIRVELEEAALRPLYLWVNGKLFPVEEGGGD